VVTALTLAKEVDEWASLPPIGKPIDNARLYILDARRKLLPFGVAGEIYIGGLGVARGYLRRPELTSERFNNDPFGIEPFARMYATGDLGRWRADGTLEYLGRNDDQVKIRGYRVELGEIEAELMLHEKVREAAVVAREDIPGEKRLVAYVVPADGRVVGTEELRVDLKAALPDYMVPTAFVIIDSLPVTSTGKLNRLALPAPELAAYVSKEYEAPQGEIEAAVAGIWRELLHVERVGRQDNFFELGGHSLLATRVMTYISHLLDVDLPLRVLFEKPSVAELGDCIVQEIAAEVSMEAV
jgi:acyl-CoA synthetase (AMP-forming)/AMP-acid ligase II